MSPLAPLVFPPLSVLYGGIVRARAALYKRGTFRRSRLDAPVISVGNITTGGTGKTPLVAWLAGVLAREGRKVCILTRGYGRQNASRMVIVSDGKEVQATPDEAGDEPFLLASKLKGVAAVISNADRKTAGDLAIRQFAVDTFILDDGFQHLRLHRDLDIVTVDATNPWAGGFLLPFGRLREPPSSLRRAGCIILTRTEQVENSEAILKVIADVSDERPVFVSRMQVSRFSAAMDASSIKSPQNPVAAFCAVGNPQAFFKQLQNEGCELVLKRSFPDHHRYKEREVRMLVEEARLGGARSLVTTEKDAVKLNAFKFDLPCYVLEIEIAITQEQELLQMIRSVL